MKTIFESFKSTLNERHLWDIFTYVFFGVLTTLINILVFAIVTKLGANWMIANFLAWFLSVLFAFVTNKLWVFESHTTNLPSLCWEVVKFFAARIASLAIDYACMFVFIQVCNWSNMVAKLLTQVIIVAVNYLLSKFIIFKNKPSDISQK